MFCDDAVSPPAASPSGRLDATVTSPPPASFELLVISSVSVLIATRFVGSNLRSRISSVSVTVSTLTSTIALPKPTRASSSRSTRSRSICALSSAPDAGAASSTALISVPFASITATSSGERPETADATRNRIALACCGVSPPPFGVTATDAVGVTLRWKGLDPVDAMWTRANAMCGPDTIVRANSPSLARQYAASNICDVVPNPVRESSSS